MYVWVGDLEHMKQWVAKEFTEDDETEFVKYVVTFTQTKSQAASYFYNNCNGTGIIWIPDFPTNLIQCATILHEVMHSTFFMLDFCGVDYCVGGNNEAFTYLGEHIFRNVMTDDGYEEFLNDGESHDTPD